MTSDRRQRFQKYRLVFQPQVNLATSFGNAYAIRGVEALLRSVDNTMSARELIRHAELAGDLDALEEWALYTVCEQGVEWLNSGHKTRISINLSGPHLDSPTFPAILSRILSETKMPPALLMLEISEQKFLDSSTRGVDILRDLRRTGVELLRDNFGTRYSWVSDIRSPLFDGIKIAPSFVKDIAEDTTRATVRAVIDVCRTRNVGVIATGVETETQRDMLLELGCTVQQGCFFSPPLTPVMTELLYLRH